MGGVMNAICSLDDFLLDRVFQPAANCSSRWFGLLTINLATFLIVSATLTWFGLVLFETRIPPALRAYLLFSAFIIAWLNWVFVKETRQNLKLGFVNPARHRLFLPRVGDWLLLLLPLWSNLPYLLYVVLIFSGHYILSCDPGPPRLRRRRALHLSAALSAGAT